MKIILLVQHLSTGGMPQYVCWMVEELIKRSEEVYVIEFSDIAPSYVVQKNKIKNIIGDNLITLYGSDQEKSVNLFNKINDIGPDVIHLQEFPEMWLPDFISKKMYDTDRAYSIVETSHDSGFDPKSKKYFPDKFAFISNFHPPLYSHLDIPYDIIEYPILKHDRPDRKQSLETLGLDPNCKHVLNVGLFTPRKNQAEIFDIARMMENENIVFHFVGNQADNFRDYWEPLTGNNPHNCKIWGERVDVDSFYKCMDLFLFTSKGTDKDRETNPLVLKEAIGWSMPVLMYNLPVYCGMYDSFDNVYFLDDSVNKNVLKIKEVLFNDHPLVSNEVPDDLSLFFDTLGITWDGEHNRINFQCNCEIDGSINLVIGVRDLDTHIPYYSCNAGFLSYTGYWIVLAPMDHMVIDDMESHRGFLIRFYDEDKNKIYEHELKISNENFPVIKEYDYIPFDDSVFGNFIEFNYHRTYAEMDFAKGGTVIDIGANVGFFTEYALNNGASQVFSIEPSESSLPCLRILHGNDDRVIIISKAIYNARGKISFCQFVSSTINTIASLTDKEGSIVEVESVLLEDIFSEYNIEHVDVLKIDVEGAEYDIFGSTPDFIFDKIDKMIIEFHPFGFHKLRSNILNKLDKNGFTYYFQRQDDALYIDERDNFGIIFAYKNMFVPLKLNIGCGYDLMKGFVNIDLHNAKADKVMDIRNLDYEDDSVDQIYSDHLLEHFGKYELESVLKECYRVLKSGKQLISIVPNLEYCLKEWLSADEFDRENSRLDSIFGNQESSGGFHKTGFTRANLKSILKSAGFSTVYIFNIKKHNQECYIFRANKL